MRIVINLRINEFFDWLIYCTFLKDPASGRLLNESRMKQQTAVRGPRAVQFERQAQRKETQSGSRCKTRYV